MEKPLSWGNIVVVVARKWSNLLSYVIIENGEGNLNPYYISKFVFRVLDILILKQSSCAIILITMNCLYFKIKIQFLKCLRTSS